MSWETLFRCWDGLVMSLQPGSAGNVQAIFDSVDCQDRARTPCSIGTTVRAVVQLFSVSSCGSPLNGVKMLFASGELTKKTATIRISAARAAV